MLFFIQVETVGDKYMTVSGLPEPCTHHAKSICHLALDMLEIAGQVKVDDEPVQVWEDFSEVPCILWINIWVLQQTPAKYRQN